MRVSIQINDQEAAVATQPGAGQPAEASAAPAAPMSAAMPASLAAPLSAMGDTQAPPAELAARAAAAGALSAGPAPVGGSEGGAPPLPTMVPGTPATPQGVSADLSAGAAQPTAGGEPTVVMAAEDDEEGLEEDQ